MDTVDILKETQKAYLLKKQNIEFWVQKRWYNKDTNTLTKKGIENFELAKEKFEYGLTTKQINEKLSSGKEKISLNIWTKDEYTVRLYFNTVDRKSLGYIERKTIEKKPHGYYERHRYAKGEKLTKTFINYYLDENLKNKIFDKIKDVYSYEIQKEIDLSSKHSQVYDFDLDNFIVEKLFDMPKYTVIGINASNDEMMDYEIPFTDVIDETYLSEIELNKDLPIYVNSNEIDYEKLKELCNFADKNNKIIHATVSEDKVAEYKFLGFEINE